MNKIFDAHDAKQLKRFHTKLVGAGMSTNEKVPQLALHYISFEKMKIPEVRKLIVANVEDFLIMASQDEYIKETFPDTLFTHLHLKFNIGFGDIEGRFQEPPYVAYAYLDQGIVHYCFEDMLFWHFIDEESQEETYEKALEIVKEDLPENTSSD